MREGQGRFPVQPYFFTGKSFLSVSPSRSKMKALLCFLSFFVLASADNVRLTKGDKTGDGRLEVNLDGRWGLVCGDNFDISDAHVVCKQLGYSEQATINTNRLDGDGLPFVMGNVRCSGVEDSIFDCEYDKNPSCNDKRLADITCGEEPVVGVTGSLGRSAGIIAAIAMCFVALIGITILLIGCVWRNQLFGINCCGANTAV